LHTLSSVNLDDAHQLLGELERAETRLREIERGLERSHRLVTLGTLASSIAHEFNNLLTPVISYCEMALASPGDAEIAIKALQRSLDGSRRAARICESMLGFVREEPASTKACTVGQAIEDTLACMARSPEKDNISLQVNVPRDCSVEIESIQLQQVLLNLVLNARQAIGRRGGRISLNARRQVGSVEIEVADTGPGIPSKVLPNIFEPFVTMREQSSQSGNEGTGLGLAICRELIERAGGTISIPKSDSSGTTFLIRLPSSEANR
jgi:signal transduction histidine kinase